MKNDVHPMRVVLKAIFLFVAFNVFFALVEPPIGKITLYNSFVLGRLRFPYEEKPSFYFVGYSVPIYENFDAMFGSHVISKRKSADEYRLILLGDSSTWGFGLSPYETLSEQINRLDIQTCDGRHVRTYNLAYPYPYPVRDLLILKKAMEYQPDMIFWLITLSTLEPKPGEINIMVSNLESYRQLAKDYDLKPSRFSEFVQEPSFVEKTIVGQRKRLKSLALLQAFGVLWAATGIDNHESLEPEAAPPSSDVQSDIDYEGRTPEDASYLFDSLIMDVMSAAFKVNEDVPIILVNEPIFVANGENYLIRYNRFYPRWAYDEYRDFIVEWSKKQNLTFLDYWNAIPSEDFADQSFHRRLSGEKRFAELLAPEIRKLVCP